MSFPTDHHPSDAVPSAQEEHTLPGQHSRSSSIQSTSTDYSPPHTAADNNKESKFPDIVRRDMEFFMARLTRTNSNDSNVSR
ncbi:hypothetical protein C8A00DRAFT_31750 [Chaetomidium leptoderma]|uniref:Uncharacterized protein n=1 Tax=Chaetomidium leptoderma TaxID=669021 RepID=A0AAN6VSB0_9PEZI|nr:hypothetical protein C8A00DRAFT_31750 [Chaetomidium leptoderma]